jgi:hypothetical protein
MTYIMRHIVGRHLKELTDEQITALLTYEGNFQPLPASPNQSKAGTLPSKWTTFRGKPISPEYRKEARKYEVRIMAELTNMMQRFLAENRQRRQQQPKKRKRP